MQHIRQWLIQATVQLLPSELLIEEAREDCQISIQIKLSQQKGAARFNCKLLVQKTPDVTN